VVAGFNLNCVGDDLKYSFLPSISGDTLADKIARYAYKTSEIEYTEYSFLTRGSDERQYCWPGIDMPVVSLMRSKYHTFCEYHTSLDNLDFVNSDGLQKSFELHMLVVKILESNTKYRTANLCEPFLGKRDLYPSKSTLNTAKSSSRALIDFMIYCDGNRDLVDIGQLLNMKFDEVVAIVDLLVAQKLIVKID